MISEAATTLLDVFRVWYHKIRRSVRVADVVRVTAYDRDTQTADVIQVVAEDRFVLDERRRVAPVVIKGCPVVWPASGTAGLSMDLQVGDEALAIFRTRDHDAIDANEVEDGQLGRGVRRMDLADAIIIPLYVRPAVGVEAGRVHSSGGPVFFYGAGLTMRMGDSTAAKALALAEDVDDRLDTIVSAFNAHTHGGPPAAPLVTQPLPSVACNDIKVRS